MLTAAVVPMRFVAVDWSGAATGARRSIWRAEVRDGVDTEPQAGLDRDDVVDLLLAAAARDDALVVGLDFAFSFPGWFVRELGAADAPSVWRIVAREGETWLQKPEPPFWRAKKPQLAQDWFRRTEHDVRRAGAQPKSVFQLGGAGQVGTSSLRGMPYLLRLRERFSIWPFDEPRLPLVVEIYPRLFADLHGRGLPAGLNDHARDALVSARAMARWRGDWTALPMDDRYRLEGRIWHPGIVSRAE